MDERVERVIRDYDERHRAETAEMNALPWHEATPRIDEFLIPIGHATGQFVHDLAVAAKAQLIVEFGTSYGYSALWLAMAARETGGRLVSLDIAAGKQAYAREQLERAGLAGHVEFVLGDAVESARRLDGPVDFVLIDLWKDLYIPSFDAIYPKLASPAFIVADNMIDPPNNHAEAEAYRAHVRMHVPQTVLLPLGSGIELSRFER